MPITPKTGSLFHADSQAFTCNHASHIKVLGMSYGLQVMRDSSRFPG